jgi:glutathione synthase/RimK-type ligase-like ATP-grasp enzyme
MKTIAILVTHDYYPGRPDRNEPDYAQDQLRLLRTALAPLGIAIEPVFWQDPKKDWSRFEAVLPLLAWNYPQQVDVFLNCLDQIQAAGVLILNAPDVLRGNMDKGYLASLAAKGAPVPETLTVETVTPDVIQACFERFQTDEIIVKPRIGAGAWRQARLKRGAPIPPADQLPPGAALIQSFLPAVTNEGELSLLYFGGTFSHALIKTPKAGDYRTQGQFGAHERAIDPPVGALAAAQAVLNCAQGAPFTYARVDLVRGPNDSWLLMELELIEPWLYLAHDGQGGRHGAALLAKVIAARVS